MGRSKAVLAVPFIIVETTKMLMDNVCRDCIKERAVMGPESDINESVQQIPTARTRRRVFRATSGDNLLAMLTHSGRLDTDQRDA